MTNKRIDILIDACKQHQLKASLHPILAEMEEQRVPAVERFSAIDVFLHMSMTFADINNHLLYEPESKNIYQQAINAHTQADGTHWKLLMKDLDTLGLNKTQTVEQTCLNLWSEETIWIRKYMYSVLHRFGNAKNYPLKLAFMLGNESTVELFFERIVHAAHQYEQHTGQKLHYPGDAHLESEEAHPFDFEAFSSLEFDEETLQQALDMIEQHFKDFEDFMDGKWAWTKKRMSQYLT